MSAQAVYDYNFKIPVFPVVGHQLHPSHPHYVPLENFVICSHRLAGIYTRFRRNPDLHGLVVGRSFQGIGGGRNRGALLQVFFFKLIGLILVDNLVEALRDLVEYYLDIVQILMADEQISGFSGI